VIVASSLTEVLAEQYRVADIVLRGTAVPPDWRAAYWPHAMIVNTAARLRSDSADVVDVGQLLDALHEADPAWPWAVHLDLLFSEWDRLEDVVAARRQARRDVVTVYGLILDAEKALDDRVTDLLAAREAAEEALETVNRAYSLFEAKARAVFAEAA
jgi:hypothetical protein